MRARTHRANVPDSKYICFDISWVLYHNLDGQINRYHESSLNAVAFAAVSAMESMDYKRDFKPSYCSKAQQ